MRVSEIMHTPAVSCRTTTPLREVARLMSTHEIGSVVVVDGDGSVSGIVTDRDIALRAVGHGHSADIAVDAIMTRDVACISPAADIQDAAVRMQKRAVRRLPVVDDRGAIHGVIAIDDLFRSLSHEVDALSDALLAQAVHLDPAT